MMSGNVENKLPDQNQITCDGDNFDKSIEEIFRLMNKYEDLVIKIQKEAKQFRHENSKLKESLAEIIEENNQLKARDNDDSIAEFRKEYINVADRIFNNLHNQLFLINQEKEMFENLWRKTASVLEREVPINSITKLKSEHSLEVEQLKSELIACQNDNDKHTKINKILQENTKLLLQKIDVLQKQNVMLINKTKEISDKLNKCNDERTETERLLEESNHLNKEQLTNSLVSNQKLQEAMRVADEAMSEIQSLASEKRQIEDEYNNLAQTIGAVIESASQKIDQDMEKMKAKHQRDIDITQTEKENLKHVLETEKSKTNDALQHIKRLEEEIQHANQTRSFLDRDLQSALQTIIDTEMKLNQMKQTINNEQGTNKQCQYEIEKLRKIIAHNSKSKEKWKTLLIDITKKLEEKIKNLIIENYELKSSRRLQPFN